MLTKAEIIDGLFSLSIEDRLDVLALLNRELDPEDNGVDALSPEWRAEIERRMDEIDNGTAVLIPWEDVKARLQSRLAALDAARDHAN